MPRSTLARFSECFAWVVAFAALWLFARMWLAPDECLDRGGSFDYVAWECDLASSHVYVHVPFFAHAEFWVASVCILLATGLSIAIRVRGRWLPGALPSAHSGEN